MMKTRSLLLVLAALPALWMSSSCGHKDDNAKPASKLIGEWDGSQVILKYYENGQLQASDTEQLAPPDYITFKFNSDNTLSLSLSVQGDQQQGAGYYTVTGNKILVSESQGSSMLTSYQYKITGNQMELIFVETATQNNVEEKEEYHFFLTKQ